MTDQAAFMEEVARMREAVQRFVEEQASAGVGTWPLAAALGEKAVEILAVHHGEEEAMQLLGGLQEILERKVVRKE